MHGGVNQCPSRGVPADYLHPDMEYVNGEPVKRHAQVSRSHRAAAERAGHKNRYRIPDVSVMALPYRSLCWPLRPT